jgi:hypothetical protein
VRIAVRKPAEPTGKPAALLTALSIDRRCLDAEMFATGFARVRSRWNAVGDGTVKRQVTENPVGLYEATASFTFRDPARSTRASKPDQPSIAGLFASQYVPLPAAFACVC